MRRFRKDGHSLNVAMELRMVGSNDSRRLLEAAVQGSALFGVPVKGTGKARVAL